MRGLPKSKRVSWASDVNLCQVRLFLSEESPAQVGVGAQDHLQAKTPWVSTSTATTTDEILPPGFESHVANELQIKASDIPVIKWRCPNRFVVNSKWKVVSGEESKEVEAQNQREMRVLEAVYPRLSAVPPNPTISADVEGSPQNAHQTTLIPITPIEDEDSTDTPALGPSTLPMSSQSQLIPPGFPSSQCSVHSMPNAPVSERPTAGMLHGVEPDALAAASAAFAALNKSNEHGSLIDHDLLVKILSNPKLIEKLVADYGTSSSAQNIPKPTVSFSPLSDPLPSVTSLDPSHLQMFRKDLSTPSSLPVTSTGPFYAQPNGVGLGVPPNLRVPPPSVPASSAPSAVAFPAKDANYYKNLIQQHGGDRQETHQFASHYNHQLGANQESVNHRVRDLRPKIMKPCIYFNSPRGCRNGANCAYQHDTSSQQRGSGISEAPNAKRTKMDREISS